MKEVNQEKKHKKTFIWIIVIFLSILIGATIASIPTYYSIKNKNANLSKRNENNKNYYLAQLTSLENQLIKKQSQLSKLNDNLKKINNENNNAKSDLEKEIKTLESESNILRERILSINSILKSKDMEISELLEKLKEFKDKYLPSEDVDHEDFKNDNFDIVLSTTYEKSYDTDPLKPFTKDDYSTKISLKRNYNKNNFTEKEILFEFDDNFYKKMLEYAKHMANQNNQDDISLYWEDLFVYFLSYLGANQAGAYSVNTKLFYFLIDEGDLIDIHYLNKNLDLQTVSFNLHYFYDSKNVLNIDKIYKSGKHYRIVIKIKTGTNRQPSHKYYHDKDINKYLKYYINNDWNIENYSIDEKSQNNEDIKFYWKEYKTRDEEDNMPAHVDLIIYLSAKKQKELFQNLESDINEKAAILKNILNEELKTKQWYLDLDKTYEKEITSWNVDNNNFLLEYQNRFTNNSDKMPLYFNMLRLNFLEKKDYHDNYDIFD
ncbi:hypothetical protein KQ875_00420 [Mycoplasma zalophi]|uniref:DUF31 domain-containing protein n=1 Tax=Mycoplasma zalophi TaxID=191287 RepID=A0ABS6DP11_9MOLU|nr:hypothetical protein [Mycoplasma zalophi]MBU4692062.1 hypothetical protein [Mycoplasma zalophi]